LDAKRDSTGFNYSPVNTMRCEASRVGSLLDAISHLPSFQFPPITAFKTVAKAKDFMTGRTYDFGNQYHMFYGYDGAMPT
jgi:hypothetical protein